MKEAQKIGAGDKKEQREHNRTALDCKTSYANYLNRCANARRFDGGMTKVFPEVTEEADIQKLTSELQIREKELVMQNEEMQRLCREEEMALRHYEELYDLAQIGYLNLDQNNVIMEINHTGSQLFGTERENLLGKSFVQWVAEDSREDYRRNQLSLFKSGQIQTYKLKLLKKNGSHFYASLMGCVMKDMQENSTHCLIALTDISESVDAETKLQETNTALRVLLDHREKDRSEMEEKVLSNIRKLVIPYLDQLQETSLRGDQAQYLEIIKANLENVTSPFLHSLASQNYNFTPREVEIVNLVKNGLTAKDIAVVLCISQRSVEFHKDNIRKKMGLTNKKVSLQSYLALLDKTTPRSESRSEI